VTSGIIFDIMKYAIHDGPGIRTTVFLKGCPLNCWWCHNPESQSIKSEIMLWDNKCIGCKDCEKACPSGLLSRATCTMCGNCIDVCPAGARELVGKRVAAQEVLEKIEQDMVFYDESRGGVTFSGGEPLMQADFLREVLDLCKQKEIHTCLDTTGYVDTKTLLEISKKIDLFLYDLKLMDDEKHKKYTGVSNSIIIENLMELSKVHDNINIRFPLIPGINDDKENILAMGEFINSLRGIKRLNILPYHRIGNDKYNRLQKECMLSTIHTPSAELIDTVMEPLKEFGLQIKIGG